MSERRIVVSAKVSEDLVERIKSDGVPISRIIEAGMSHYSELSEDEKKEFLLTHTPGVLETKEGRSLLKTASLIPLVVLGAALTSILGMGAGSVSGIKLSDDE